MAYKAYIRETKKIGDGKYFVQRYSLGEMIIYNILRFFGAIISFPFKLTYWMLIKWPYLLVKKLILAIFSKRDSE